MSFAEASDLDHRIRQAAIDMIDRLADDTSFRIELPSKDEQHLDKDTLREFLERILAWDAAAWFSQRERFVATYPGPFFQPPDGASRIIFQASVGNRGPSTFDCQPTVTYQLRNSEAFEKHVKAIVKLWGKRVSQARAAFLAGSDILHQDPELVRAYLAAIRDALPPSDSSAESNTSDLRSDMARLEGTHLFLEDFPAEVPFSAALKSYRELGLTRVHLGIESGDPEIRQQFGKSWTNSQLERWVNEIKSTIGSLSILLLDTPCRPDQLAGHQEQTLELLARLPLGPGDVVAILDGSDLLTGRAFVPSYDPVERLQGQANLKSMLKSIQVEQKAKVAVCSLDKLWM
ncbi:hypothetical protein [Singulisphaera sp. PoT]|uniref:hypothetical protein n=1 Tax=Singulisphaera sp. PoT TaxID=3411797 RepID=UPI003BF5650B